MSKKGFPQEVRIEMAEVYNGYCCVKNCIKKIHSFHHKLPQTNYNQKNYPLFINSVFNCAPVCSKHHKNCRKYPELNITEVEAEVYEKWLEKLVQ